MPYMKVKDGENVDVYKKGPDGKPEGKRLGRHKSEADADKQIAAIHVNEKSFQVGAKYWEDDFMPMPDMPMKLEQSDPRAQYNPLGGTDTQACANCQWFCARNASCCLVWDDIVATGKCNLWLAEPSPATPTPVPVVIVADQTGNAEAKPADTPGPLAAFRAMKEKVGELFRPGQPAPTLIGFKELPGDHWCAFFTNNFADKGDEIFTEAAHDRYIDWLDQGLLPYPELWYWHIPGTRHGQAEWVGREGHIMIAVGKYDDTNMARLFRKEYQRRPHRVSHTYGYPAAAKQDGVYHAYFSVEISPLPIGEEANEWTAFTAEVKEMAQSPKKLEALAFILGDGDPAKGKPEAEKIIAGASEESKKAEATGARYKEAADKAAETQFTDATAREAIKELAVANKAALDSTVQTMTALIEKIVGEKLTALQNDLKAVGEKANAQQQQANDLKQFVQEQFKLEPRASQAAATIVPKDSPMAAMLAAKAADPTAQTPDANGQPPDAFNTIAGWFTKPPAPQA